VSTVLYSHLSLNNTTLVNNRDKIHNEQNPLKKDACSEYINMENKREMWVKSLFSLVDDI
jgi:hypothetical protein